MSRLWKNPHIRCISQTPEEPAFQLLPKKEKTNWPVTVPLGQTRSDNLLVQVVYNYLKTLESSGELSEEPLDLEFGTDNLLLLDPIGEQLEDFLLEHSPTVQSAVMIPPHSTMSSKAVLKNRTLKLSSPATENFPGPQSDRTDESPWSSVEQDAEKAQELNKGDKNDREKKEKAVDAIVQKLKEKSEKQKSQEQELKKKEELKQIEEGKQQENERKRKMEDLKRIEEEERQEQGIQRKKKELKLTGEEKRQEKKQI